MIKCICFLAHDMDAELERQIMQLDTPENEVHLVTNIMEDDFYPPIILSFLEENGFRLEDTLHFYSDMENLCRIVEVIYRRIFQKVLCFQRKEKIDYELDEFYSVVLEYPKKEIGKEYCIYYKLENTYFVCEPIIGKPLVITNDKIQYNIPPSADICYMFPYFEEAIDKIQASVCGISNKEYVETATYFVIPFLHELHDKKDRQPISFNMFIIALENIILKAEIKNKEILMYHLLCLSFMIRETEQGRFVEHFNRIIYENSKHLSCYEKYYLWRQQKRYFFHMKNLQVEQDYSENIYKGIYADYYTECKEYLKVIPKEERSEDKIIVLTLQFLKEVHAPTRTTLERCVTLQRELGKEVTIINTLEQLTTLGEIPLYMSQSGNILKEYEELHEYSYQDVSFIYKQCKGKMPNIKETKEILQFIREKKPFVILTMGVGSIVSDLAANIAPVINIPLVFSTIVKKDNQFTSLGRKLTQKEWDKLLAGGIEKESVIEGTFTFDIKEQKEHFTRETFHLPQDKFLLLVVGLRLHYDVDDEFISVMSMLYNLGIHIVFAGYFDNYEEMCKKHGGLREHSTFIGLQADILAVNEIVDLYVNPKRLGGGFSMAEAFSKGKPGITINYGDVGATAGEEFRVNSYEEMINEIKKYITQPEYYRKKSREALERVKELTDSKTALQNILQEAQKRKLFF